MLRDALAARGRTTPRALAALAVIAAYSTLACVRGGDWRPSHRPTGAEARGYYYRDNTGLSVTTTAASVEVPIHRKASVFGRALADHIVLTPRPPEALHVDAPDQPTGHGHEGHPDAVTSASAIVADSAGANKWRYEGVLGAEYDETIEGAPVRVRAFGRASTETDYKSLSGVARVTTELLNRNLTVSAFGGYGRDRVTPYEAPPGQSDFWPATHDRWLVGVTLSQILSRRMVLSGGVATTWQRGTLANPYRRAIVRTSLFPEDVPIRRRRYTAFVGLSWYLGWGLALHGQQGAYIDDWSVRSLVPEVALVKAFGRDAIASIRYRYYTQTAADFYAVRYDALGGFITGDARLDSVREHMVGGAVRWTLFGELDEAGSMFLVGGYDFSTIRYVRRDVGVLAHILTLAIGGAI